MQIKFIIIILKKLFLFCNGLHFFNRAIVRKCNNALHPDLYGHYREAQFTQTKHHWWWKANRVFDQLEITRYHTGLVLFLEEDHYVAEDFLYLLELMQRRAIELCPQCNILSLGTYLKTFNYYTYNSKVSIFYKFLTKFLFFFDPTTKCIKLMFTYIY